MNAVAGPGTSFMSDSWIAWKPRIEDPSNICPTVKKSSSTDSAGTLKCCMTPGRSQNRMSTNLTSSSLMNVRTSSAELNIQPPDVGRGRRPVLGSAERQGSRDGLVLSVSTLSTADFSAMTLMFHGCYGWTGPGKEPEPCLVTLDPWWTARISARG